ncbi:MAG: cation:proton antiporter [Desulfotomaculales bacterium]
MVQTGLLVNLSIIFIFVALATVISSRLNLSSIPLLIFFGMLTGPFAPDVAGFSLQLVTPGETTELLSRLGVLMLLFYLGLEFSAGKLASGGRSLLLGGVLYVSLNFLRGLALGELFFSSLNDVLAVAGITVISSSAIVTKLLVDLRRAANPETEFILGILVVEDIFIAVYLSVYTGITGSGEFLWGPFFLQMLAIGGLLLFVLLFGKKINVIFERGLRLKSEECFTLVVIALLLVSGVAVEKIGVAEATGALLLGLILAETTHSRRVVQVVLPLRDLFGAVFFYSFGMGINYRKFGEVIFIALAFVAATVAGNIFSGLLASWLAGHRGRRAFHVAFAVMARGEFSVLFASLAAASGASWLLPGTAAIYIFILAFLGPFLAKNARLFYEFFLRIKGLAKKENLIDNKKTKF